jgi:hypothetical protein
MVGSDYKEIRVKMGKLIEHVRKVRPSFQWVWAVEANPNGNGCHIHGFCFVAKGHRMITTRDFMHSMMQAGFCLADGQLPRRTLSELIPGTGAEYLQYPMKSLRDPQLAGRFLDLNGTQKRRQLIHASNGFWRDGADGPTLKNMNEAKSLSYRRSRMALRRGTTPGDGCKRRRPDGTTDGWR